MYTPNVLIIIFGLVQGVHQVGIIHIFGGLISTKHYIFV